MNYSVTNLTQVADCDLLLAWAAQEKSDLAFKKTAEERLTVKFATTSTEIEATLQGVVADIAAEESIIDSLPDGEVKDDHMVRLTKLVYKKFLLETRRESYGVIALLQKQTEVARVGQQIEEVDAFINAIDAQRATIVAAA